MHADISPEDAAFRAEVRAFLEQRLTTELRAAAALQTGVFAEADLNRRWQRILFEQGWVAPGWPGEHGGAGFTAVQRHIFETELAAAGAPILPAMGLQMCGPVLIEFGSPEQKAFFLPRILSGEHYWCQGYSEPQAGSDLAALQTRAVRDGEAYRVSGSKIWTTHAHVANWIFLLARTAFEGKPQAGITFLLAPLDTPGVSVRPIYSISGDHEVNQVFFDDVEIPLARRVGGENHGWTVAKHLLQFERGGFYAARMKYDLARLKTAYRSELASGDAKAAPVPLGRRFADLDIAVAAVEMTELRLLSQLAAGRAAGDASASLLKLQGTETDQLISELALDLAGLYAAVAQPSATRTGDSAPIGPAHSLTATARYLNKRAASIFGGANEVQRNIMARAVIGT